VSPSAAALVCIEFSHLIAGASISLPYTVGDVTVSTTAMPSVAEIRAYGSPSSVGLGVSKAEFTFHYKKQQNALR